MAQAVRTFAPPNAGSFPVTFGPADMAGIRSVEVDNGSALTLTLTANGQIIRTIAPYIARFSLNTGGGWDTISITADGATIQPTDSLTVNAYDTAITPPLLPSYGPAAWGGGAVPSTLVNVNPGDQFMAWQVQQIIDYLGGGLPGSTTFQLGPGQAFTVEDFSFRSYFEVITSPITAAVFSVPVTFQQAIQAQKRISSPAVGASGKPLLNYCPFSASTGQTFNGTGNQAASTFTVTGLLSSAVAVSGILSLNSSTPGAGVNIRTTTTSPVAIGQAFSSGTIGDGAVIGACTPGTAGQLSYEVFNTAGAFWVFDFTLTGYWEAS